LCAVNSNFVVKLGCALGQVNLQKLKVFNFSEETYECRVKIDSNKAFNGKLSWFSLKQEHVEFIVSRLFDSCLPLSDLLVLELFQVLAERVVQLLHILELLTFLDGGGEVGKTLH